MSNVKVKCFIGGELDTNTYVISKGNECILIDPTGDNAPIDKYVFDNNLTISGMLLTHGHFDHTELVKHYQSFGIKAYIHEEDNKMLSSKTNLALAIGKYNFEYTSADILLKNDEILNIAGFFVKVVHTPGHTKGSVFYVFEDDDIMFSGDTLFKLSYGRTDFFGGSFDELLESFKKLFKIDKDYVVFTGHGNKTSFLYEKRNNPIFLDANENA